MKFKKIVSLMLSCALIINPSASFASAKTLLATEKIKNSKIKNNNSLKNHNEDNEDDNSTKTEKEEYKKHLEEIENFKKEVEKLKDKAEKSANNSASADAELYSRTGLIIASKFIGAAFLYPICVNNNSSLLGMLSTLVGICGFYGIFILGL